MELIFLHGGAASGKLTTARELSYRLNYPVFHNHLVVDLLSAIFQFGSESFIRLREQMWLSVFDEAARAGRSLIFTFTPESTVQGGFVERARAAIEDHNGHVRFVRLTVSEGEQERRIGAPDRREFHKLIDIDTLKRLRNYEDRNRADPPTHLHIDTDASSARESAETIIEHFGLTPQGVVERYPDA